MLTGRRLAILAAIGLVAGLAATSQAANQQYQGSLVIESFGNDVVGTMTPFSVFGMPQGVQCNISQPMCSSGATPTGTTMSMGMTYNVFKPLGAGCKAIGFFGVGARPGKGSTPTTGTLQGPKNVRYRNPNFFTGGGAPNTNVCTATTTIGMGVATTFLTTNDPLRGVVMKGNPLTGEQIVTLSGTGPAGILLKAAPTAPVKTPGPTGFGLRRTTSGEFNNIFPYVYSYTYATLRNDAGSFFGSSGLGAFDKKYLQGANTLAHIVVKAGTNQFGGVMRLLGQLTTKVCYFRNGGCSLGGNNWRYDAVGASAFKVAGMVTKGYQALYTAMYYHTVQMAMSTVMVKGYRFPWTTGSVTVSGLDAPHVTREKRQGTDLRTALGKGTIQLVTPVLTRWTQPAFDQFTGGVGVLRLQFVPEPGTWMMLVAGFATLGILYRARGR